MLDVFWFLDSFKFQWPVAVRAPGTCGRSNALAPWLPRFYMSPMESYLWCISTQIPVGLYILGGYSLKFRPYIGFIYGRYLQFRFLKWPLTVGLNESQVLLSSKITVDVSETCQNPGFRGNPLGFLWTKT